MVLVPAAHPGRQYGSFWAAAGSADTILSQLLLLLELDWADIPDRERSHLGL